VTVVLGAVSVGGCNVLAGIGDLPYPSEASDDGGSEVGVYEAGGSEGGATDASGMDSNTAVDGQQPGHDAQDAGGEAGDATVGDADAGGDAGDGGTAIDASMAEAAAEADVDSADDAPTADGADLAAAYFVQVGANNLSGTGAPTLSVSAALPGTVQAHDTLIIAADYTNATAPTLSDSLGNTFVRVVGPFGDGVGTWASIWYVADALPGTETVTAMLSSGTVNDYVELYVHEYRGLHGLDSATDATGNTVAISSGPFSTSQANDLLFAYIATGAADPVAPYVARSGFNSNLSEDTLAGPAGSYTAVAKSTGGGGWIIVAAGFKTH
jgi:hypothetical protein